MIRPRLALIGLAAALPLSGCISFGAKPPPSLMALTATTPLEAGPARTTDDTRAVAVAMPSSIAELATRRVMVSDGPTAVAYLKDALWAAPPTLLFRSLLAETITVKTGRVVPDPRLLASQPNTRISGQLSSFGVDARAMAAVVTFDAAMVRTGSGQLQSRRFTARVPVATVEPVTVAVALNQAANQVAGEVADWVGR